MKNGQGDSLCMQRGVALFFHSIEMETEQRWKFLERRMGTVPVGSITRIFFSLTSNNIAKFLEGMEFGFHHRNLILD